MTRTPYLTDADETELTLKVQALEVTQANDYEFVSEQARRAGRRYGVRSVSVLARRP